ncbi:MAG: type II toxin-antitoxin system VapC family toxin [Verrucomicrobiaceae bacterium]|nr:type II toxin-antitoxin system VapC family toxin [Verrucomicrobiaceae bacterium]
MSATADSSLIVALYLAEVDSSRADDACASVPPPLQLTDWHRVEIANAFQRAVRNGRITAAQAAHLWQDFTGDIAAGRFEVIAIDHAAVLARTLTLTQKHTATLGTRSLDLIHIASALEMRASDFLSLDKRQRQAADAEGLKVIP